MSHFNFLKFLLLIVCLGMSGSRVYGQFFDDFSNNDSPANTGWTYFTGDGAAEIDFKIKNGAASVYVDATKDKRGIWWALIRHHISNNMNLDLLYDPGYELRVEAKIRVSDAPKRVNLHFNTQRTTNFHSHLMEYDIPDTSGWHVISMTTRNFDAHNGDTVYAQMALMDWGLKKYRLDIDYFRADIVNVDSVGADKGFPLPYHPPIPSLESFSETVTVSDDATLDTIYEEMNFNKWIARDIRDVNLLSVNGSQFVILKLDLTRYKGKKVRGSGILDIITFSLAVSPEYQKDFGMIRVSEIIGGNPSWMQNEITYKDFLAGDEIDRVINSQMIIDIAVDPTKGKSNLITISQPVLQRLIDGQTLGLAIKPLGAINAAFYSSDNNDNKLTPKLHFNLENSSSSSSSTK